MAFGLCGHCKNLFLFRKLPKDDYHRVNYIYNIYCGAKQFIINHGGYLTNVEVHHLLTYSDYVTFLKHIYQHRQEFNGEESPPLLDDETFYLLSKQSWMDLLLQTYKVFVLYRVKVPPSFMDINKSIKDSNIGEPSSSYNQSLSLSIKTQPNELDAKSNETTELPRDRITSLQDAIEVQRHSSFVVFDVNEDVNFWTKFCKLDTRFTNMNSESEYILLRWLEHHFNNQRQWLWTCNKYRESDMVPEAKSINYFDFDLHDGLALIAVTASHCPYLKDHLTDIYLKPQYTEQAYHNATKLLESWHLLNLSFVVTPTQIIKPHPLQMLMLVNYLYNVLPYYVPNNSLDFASGLSTSCLKEIDLENQSDSTVAYKIILLNNERNLFTVSKEHLTINKREKTKLEVTFHARKVGFENSILIISGEVPGKSYGQTFTFNLVGESVPSYCTTVITIPSGLYDVVDLEVSVQTPYQIAAVYDIYFSLTEPNNNNLNAVLSWLPVKSTKIPKRLYSSSTHVETDADGIGTVNLVVCCITTNIKVCWIILTNSEVGDFAVKIVSVPQIVREMSRTIPVHLLEEYKSSNCICRCGNGNLTYVNNKCPRVVYLNIPARNTFLWDSVLKLTSRIVEEEDLPFWEKYLGKLLLLELVINENMFGKKDDQIGHENCQITFSGCF